MFWGSFSRYGVELLLPIDGMMNTQKYLKVLEKEVVTDLSNTFPGGSGVFQEDSAPYHEAKKSNEIHEKNENQGSGMARKFPWPQFDWEFVVNHQASPL